MFYYEQALVIRENNNLFENFQEFVKTIFIKRINLSDYFDFNDHD